MAINLLFCIETYPLEFFYITGGIPGCPGDKNSRAVKLLFALLNIIYGRPVLKATSANIL